LEINVFEGVNKAELSMLEVAHAILSQKGDVMDFSDLVNEIQTYLGKSDSDIRDSLAQFYTDLNTDGRFLNVGENQWGLRDWYSVDDIEEKIAPTIQKFDILDDDDEELLVVSVLIDSGAGST